MTFFRWGQSKVALSPMLFLFFLSFASPAFAQFQIPEKPDGYVTDRAGLLSPAAVQQLDQKLRQFESETSTQVVVATFPAMDGGSIEDISVRMATQWKVGQKGRNNGVLFLIFRDDHQMRIEVGYGLEGVLTDAASSQIIRQIVTPQFRTGNFEQGVVEGTNAILAATQGEFQALSEKQGDGASVLRVLFIIILFIIVIDLFRYGVYAAQHRDYKSRYTFWEWFFLFAAFWLILRALLTSRGGSNWSSGGRGGYSGGGGFSGGGGSFGGGGASGRW